MIRLNILVEGQTEETFVRNIVSPSLSGANIFIYPRIIPTSKYGRGGGSSYLRWHTHAKEWLLNDSKAYLTTMFDVYALPTDFPNFEHSQSILDVYERANFLENEFLQSIIASAPHHPLRFLPYFQMHEFEGLLFCDLQIVESMEPTWSGRATACKAEAARFPTPEHVDGAPSSAPSKRIARHFFRPKFRKTLHGVLAAEEIGLTKMRGTCVRFNEWLAKISALPELT